MNKGVLLFDLETMLLERQTEIKKLKQCIRVITKERNNKIIEAELNR